MQSLSQNCRISILATVFGVLLAVGIGIVEFFPTVLIPLPKSEPILSSVRTISSISDFDDVTSAGCAVLFVDCWWNSEVAAYRDVFAAFAVWCRNNTSYLPVSVVLDSESQDEIWDAVQGLLESNSIPHGGLKNLGGAGRVVWIWDGQVYDYAWYSEVPEVDDLCSRSAAAFDSSLSTRRSQR